MFGKHEIDQKVDQIQNVNGLRIAMPSFLIEFHVQQLKCAVIQYDNIRIIRVKFK